MDDAIASNWAQQLADPAMPALGGRGEDSDRDSGDEAGGGRRGEQARGRGLAYRGRSDALGFA